MMCIFKHNKNQTLATNGTAAQSPFSPRCRRVFLIFLTLLASGIQGLLAQQDDKVYRVGDPGVVSPKLKRSVQPGYTEEAQANGIMGEVSISFEIDKEGKTRNVKVVEGLDTGLDKNAVTAVREWLFDPATKEGQPVVCAAKTKVNFRLR